jgi:hypothetical protein
MQMVVRKYSGKGATALVDLLQKNSAEVQSIMRSVKGFVSYALARSSDGGFSVTICQDIAGIGESGQKAKDWIIKNAAGTGAPAPEISMGEVIVHMK